MNLSAASGYNCSWEGPYAILAQITAPSMAESQLALKGLIETDPALAWTHKYDGVQQFQQSFTFMAGYSPRVQWKEHTDKVIAARSVGAEA